MAKPVIVSIPFGNNINALPRMSDERYTMLLEKNHAMLSIPTVWEDEPEIEVKPEEPVQDKPDEPDDDTDPFSDEI